MSDTTVPVSPGQAAYLNRQAHADAAGPPVAPFKIVVAQRLRPSEVDPVCQVLASTVGTIEAYRTRFSRDGRYGWKCHLVPPFEHEPTRDDVATSDAAQSRTADILELGFRRTLGPDGPRLLTHSVVAPEVAFVVTEVDHLVSDAAALVQAADFIARSVTEPGLVDSTYSEHHRWLDAWLRSDHARSRLEWWLRTLGDEPTYTPITLDGRSDDSAGRSSVGGRHRHVLDPEVAERGREAWAAGRSPFQAVAACVAVVLAAWTGREEIRLSAAIPNRHGPESRLAIAWTAGSAPLVVSARGTLAEIEASARQASMLAHLRGDLPVWEVIRAREPEIFLRGRTAPTCQVGIQHSFEWSAGTLVDLVPPPSLNGLRVTYAHEAGTLDVHYDAAWLVRDDAVAVAEGVAVVLARLLHDRTTRVDTLDLRGVRGPGPAPV